MTEVPHLSRGTVPLMSAACAFCVATIYYNQPLLPQMAASFGRPESAAGVIATCTQLGYAIGLLLFVPLGDRFDRRHLLMALLLLNMASLAAALSVPSFKGFAAANIAIGMTAVGAQVIIPAISGLVDPRRRGRTLGSLMSGMSAGLLFARALSGIVGAHAGWLAMYGVAVMLDAILMLVVSLSMPRDPRRGALSYRALMFSLWPLVKQDAELKAACLTGSLMFGAFSAGWTTLATLLVREPYLMGPDAVGLFGLVGFAGLLASPLIGRAVDAFAVRPVLTMGALSVLVAFILLGRAEWSFPALLVSLVLIDVGNRAALIANQGRVYARSDDARSRRNTVFMTCYFLGGAVGSSIGASAAGSLGWQGLSATGAGFAVATLLTHRATWTGNRAGSRTDAR